MIRLSKRSFVRDLPTNPLSNTTHNPTNMETTVGSVQELRENSRWLPNVTHKKRKTQKRGENPEGGRRSRIAPRQEPEDGSGWKEEDGGEAENEQDEQVPSVQKLELSAYAAVLRAFRAQSAGLTWTKERLLCDLRISLGISLRQHRKLTKELCLGKLQAVKRSTSRVHYGDVNSGLGSSGLPRGSAKPQRQSSPCLSQRNQLLRRATDERPYYAVIKDPENGGRGTND